MTALVVVLLTGALAAQQNDGGEIILDGQVELPRLLDLCAQRLGVRIDYDPTVLKGTSTLRSNERLSDIELWTVTNQLLSARGFTTIQASDTPRFFSVVRLADAPGMAVPNMNSDQHGLSAGYQSIVIRVRHQPVKQIIDALKLVLSKSGGFAADLGSGGLILISDTSPRLEEAVNILANLDSPGGGVVIERYELKFLTSTELSALVAAAALARDAVAGQTLPGKVIASPDGQSVIIIAPSEPNSDALTQWRSLIERFDVRQPLETRAYNPRSFSVTEVTKLIDQTRTSPKGKPGLGSNDEWRVVADELTSSVIVTATLGEHERIAALMERLDAVPLEARRPMRSFVIRNRDVNEIIDVLTKLIDQGLLEASVEQDGTTSTSGVDDTAQRSSPTSTISSIPPAGSPGQDAILSTGPIPATSSTPLANRSTGTRPIVKSRTETGIPSLILSSDEGTNTLIAVGDPRKLEQLAALIRQLDVRQPQVMLEVLVVNLSESDTLDLGMELEKLEINGTTILSLTSLFGLSRAGSGTAEPGIPRGRGFTGVVLNPGDFSIVIRALETLNKGRTLNMPKVLVNNNQQATLNAVLQQPFASTNASTTVATTSFGGTQDAGTTVTVKPQIAEGDHLILEYSVALSAFVGESDDPALPPPRQTNNLASMVTIPDGYTVVVGGLEITTEANSVSQIPIIGDIPGVGELFKSRSKSTSRSRFYVFIRSEVMRHNGFEDLKFISDRDASGVQLGTPGLEAPTVEPRIIR